MTIHYTCTENGLQTLSYKGLSYLEASNNLIIQATKWRTPLGIETDYAWNVHPISTAISKRLLKEGFEHKYADNGREFTVGFQYVPVDGRTLRVDLSVKNCNCTDTLARIDCIALGGAWHLKLPGAAIERDPSGADEFILSGHLAHGGRGQVAQLLSGSWGNVALWVGQLANNSSLQCFYSTNDQTAFNPLATNHAWHSSDQNDAAHQIEDPIKPGETWKYTFYLRFGTAEETLAKAAAPAFQQARKEFPSVLSCKDRRPIARWFIASVPYITPVNPRGFFGPEADITDTAAFRALALSRADLVVSICNDMKPRPQGVLLWDIDGNEYQNFSYGGSPHMLETVAPEMDLIADEMIAKITDVGYLFGFTIRADQIGFSNGYYHELPATEDEAYENLRLRVDYVRQRWGRHCRLFYIDTATLVDRPIPASVFHGLSLTFQDCLFIPESAFFQYHYGCVAPYAQMSQWKGIKDTGQQWLDLYPDAFSVIQPMGANLADPDVIEPFIKGMQGQGNIPFVDGWWGNPENPKVLAAWNEAHR